MLTSYQNEIGFVAHEKNFTFDPKEQCEHSHVNGHSLLGDCLVACCPVTEAIYRQPAPGIPKEKGHS